MDSVEREDSKFRFQGYRNLIEVKGKFGDGMIEVDEKFTEGDEENTVTEKTLTYE